MYTGVRIDDADVELDDSRAPSTRVSRTSREEEIRRTSIVSTKTTWVDPDLPDTPEEENGLSNTCGQIMNTMIGSGILSFPSVLSRVGLAYTVGMLLLFCTLVALSSLMMIRVGSEWGVMDFSGVTEDVLGLRWRQATDLAIFVANLGALCSYVNVIGSLGSKVVRQVCGVGRCLVVETYPGFMLVFTAVLVLPMCLKRAYGELTYIAVFSVCFIVTAVLLVFLEGRQHAQEDGGYPIRVLPLGAVPCLQFLGNFAYATSCQSAIFEAYLATRAELKGGFFKAVAGAACGGGALLVGMAVSGCWAFGDEVSSNVMLSFRQDAWGLVGPALVVAHLLFYIPNDFVIMRFYGFKLVGVNVLQIPTPAFVGATALMLALPVGLMASVPPRDVAGAFALVLGLTGDIPVGFACFVVPGLLYLRLFKPSDQWVMWVMAVLTVVAGAVCMVVCPMVDIIQFVRACRSPEGCSSY